MGPKSGEGDSFFTLANKDLLEPRFGSPNAPPGGRDSDPDHPTAGREGQMPLDGSDVNLSSFFENLT